MTDNLRIPAEQALLGSVLLDPAGQQQVLDLVESNDMYRPWHGQVLSAMQRLRGRGVTPGPLEDSPPALANNLPQRRPCSQPEAVGPPGRSSVACS